MRPTSPHQTSAQWIPPSDQTQGFATELAPHEAALRAHLYGLVNPSDIDDLAQETYARLIRAASSLPPPATPPATSFAVAPPLTQFR